MYTVVTIRKRKSQYRGSILFWRVVSLISSILLLLFLCRCIRQLSVKTFGKENYFMTRKLLQDSSVVKCTKLHGLNISAKCEFVKMKDDCINTGFIQYIQLPYCVLSHAKPFAYIILILWLVLLIVFDGIIADDYVCPALAVISDSLSLSPNVAGVTFLAYGNGAPDIFIAVASLSGDNHTGTLALSALLGAGLFVTTVVVGTVSLSTSCDLNKRPYVRDVLFYIGALAWTFIIIYRKKIDLIQALGFIILYVSYVIVVICGRLVYQRYCRKRSPAQVVEQGDFETSIPYITNAQNSCEISIQSSGSIDESAPLLVKRQISNSAKNFIQELFTVSPSDFVDSGLLRKIYTIFKLPINLCLNLTIPVIQLNENNHNWNKRLQILQCLCSPIFCVYITKGGSMKVGNLPLPALILILSVIAALAVAMTSSRDTPPRYHKMFAFMAIIASVVWIYSTANEIVNLLKTFGVIFKLSNVILGITLLAWGNSINDLIVNVAVAKKGSPKMAIAACFGGPFLNLLLGVGLSCSINILKDNGNILKLNVSYKDYITCAFLATSLVSSATIIPLIGFRIPKIYGVYLMLLYITFIIISILAESDVLF